MLDQLDGRSYLVMMLENSTTNTILLCQLQWNRKWLKYQAHEGTQTPPSPLQFVAGTIHGLLLLSVKN